MYWLEEVEALDLVTRAMVSAAQPVVPWRLYRQP
jgi:hypothetical protein